MTPNGRVLRAVVFDLDGVVIDSEHLWEEGWSAYTGRHGYRWTPADTQRTQGMSVAEWSRAIAEMIGAPNRANEARDFCVGYWIDAINAGEAPLLDGASELLTEVSRRCPIAMASSAPRRGIDAVLAQNGLTDLFTATVSSEEVPQGKPSPDVYEEAMRRLGLDPADGAAVEDSSNGIRAAHAAGLLVLAIPNATYPPKLDVLELCAYVARDHQDARRYLLPRLEKGLQS